MVPLHSLGVVDVAATDVQENEVLAHALSNINTTEKSQGWAVKRGNDFINEYARRDEQGLCFEGNTENPNHLLGSFPCLFPYGEGGFEVKRPQSVSYDNHARWALRYADKRFRSDFHFIFLVFGVLQKRQMCSAATLQVSKQTFVDKQHEIQSLTPFDFQNAAKEGISHQPFSNKTIQSLRHHLTAVRSKVMGTDESRIKIRSLVWGMCIKKNSPSVWLTINPADTQDPVAQVLAGKEIDLDNFSSINERPSDVAIASDPFAAAQFFHMTINAVLHSVLGIEGYRHNHQIKRKPGILGTVEAYVGTVEAQGRGTLHLHMLLWLKGAPTSSRMKELLQSINFREKLKQFISANIRADLPEAYGTAVLSLPRATRVAFSRPINPNNPQYKKLKDTAEQSIARTVQVHQCSQSCLKMVNSHYICKRRAPFVLSPCDWVDENGDWGPKRTYASLTTGHQQYYSAFAQIMTSSLSQMVQQPKTLHGTSQIMLQRNRKILATPLLFWPTQLLSALQTTHIKQTCTPRIKN